MSERGTQEPSPEIQEAELADINEELQTVWYEEVIPFVEDFRTAEDLEFDMLVAFVKGEVELEELAEDKEKKILLMQGKQLSLQYVGLVMRKAELEQSLTPYKRKQFRSAFENLAGSADLEAVEAQIDSIKDADPAESLQPMLDFNAFMYCRRVYEKDRTGDLYLQYEQYHTLLGFVSGVYSRWEEAGFISSSEEI
jgi:hypothetical protein